MAIFGTDGIRGRFGQPPVTPEVVQCLGRALALMLTHDNDNAHVVIARDTRYSGLELEKALIAGLTSFPIAVKCAGIIPTPALALAVADSSADLGVMITASHNPAYDNGLKIFGSDGLKLSQQQQQQLEGHLASIVPEQWPQVGRATTIDGLASYEKRLEKILLPQCWSGLHLLIDCAHGAYAPVIEKLLAISGANLTLYHAAPTGHNINENAGALNPTLLSEAVERHKPDYVLAFDGDGDRLVLFERDEPVDPHLLLIFLYEIYIAAGYPGGLVITEIANQGFVEYCERQKIPVAITPVGDRFVMHKARQNAWLLGAEPSGHYLLLDRSVSSDALMAGIVAINALRSNPGRLASLKEQLLLHEQHSSKIPLSAELKNCWDQLEPQLYALLNESQAHIKIRPSGTEPILRLTLQAPTGQLPLADIAAQWAIDATSLLEKHLIKEDL